MFGGYSLEYTVEPKIVAAISAALEDFFAAEVPLGKAETPPYIVMPSSPTAPPSLWRFMGRQESMAASTMVQMKSLRW